MNPAPKQRSTLQATAVYEAVKGQAALAGLIGILDLLHRDVRAMVMALNGDILACLAHALWQRHAHKAQP